MSFVSSDVPTDQEGKTPTPTPKLKTDLEEEKSQHKSENEEEELSYNEQFMAMMHGTGHQNTQVVQAKPED